MVVPLKVTSHCSTDLQILMISDLIVYVSTLGILHNSCGQSKIFYNTKRF